MEGDVPETVGRVHRLCIHIEGVHGAKETAWCCESLVSRLFSLATDTKAHTGLSASVWEKRNGRPRLLKLEFGQATGVRPDASASSVGETEPRQMRDKRTCYNMKIKCSITEQIRSTVGGVFIATVVKSLGVLATRSFNTRTRSPLQDEAGPRQSKKDGTHSRFP
jgi:hypothetical protein